MNNMDSKIFLVLQTFIESIQRKSIEESRSTEESNRRQPNVQIRPGLWIILHMGNPILERGMTYLIT